MSLLQNNEFNLVSALSYGSLNRMITPMQKDSATIRNASPFPETENILYIKSSNDVQAVVFVMYYQQLTV